MTSRGKKGAKNNMWRGGRSIASNGYVLIRVGIEHHLSDVRGYAYEHRVIAEKKIGRRLIKSEIVHHIDENKQNNHPDNLEVILRSHHHFYHRKKQSDLRKPFEENTTVFCGCGCGNVFQKFDKQGRPRKFISGHNTIVRGAHVKN